ncbi:MAG: hypothetical protein A3G01_03795 [Candidatus Kerfeldbacteria bacterium RIFCSPLOWO2_12_FULL_43_9]|nr:MAG: hypothetical protein A3G01_03795 [Candidatus Kerfeldbacteria bacterium RIFCSPLOWO2_12_FULL_43_9]
MALTVSGVKNPSAGGLARVMVDSVVPSDEPDCPSSDDNGDDDGEEDEHQESEVNKADDQEMCFPDMTASDPIYLGTMAVVGAVTYKGGDLDGQPVSYGWVNAGTKDFWTGSSTDRFGAYAIPLPLPQGKYQIRAEVPMGITGYIPAVKEIEYKGTTITQDLTLGIAVKTLSGTVKYADGNAVAYASVWINSRTNFMGTGAEVNEKGEYSASLDCGDYDMNLGPKWDPETNQPSSVDWMYNQPPKQVSFACDGQQQTQTVDFTVQKSDSKVIGTLVDNNGKPADGHVELRTKEGSGNGSHTDQKGKFSIPITAGTYEMNVWTQQQDLYFTGQKVEVPTGKTVDVGTLQLSKRDAQITGTVTDSNGTPLSGMNVNAWMPGAQGWSNAQTDDKGQYTLYVFVGEWEVGIHSGEGEDSSDQNYIQPQNQRVKIEKSGQTVSDINFKLEAADATIAVQVVDQDNNTMSDLYGWAFCHLEGQFGPGNEFGASVQRGQASIPVRGGETYVCGMGFPPEMPFSLEEEQKVQINSGESKDVTMRLVENDAVIHVIVKDQDGKQLKNVEGFVFAFTPEGFSHFGEPLKPDGTAHLTVRGGKKYVVGYDFRENSGYLNSHPDFKPFEVPEDSTVTRVLTAYKADASISGTVTDPDGKPMFAWVGASNRASLEDKAQLDTGVEGAQVIDTGTQTGPDGKYKLLLVSGEFEVFAGGEFGGKKDLLPPQLSSVTVKTGDALTLDMQFRSADATVSGAVTYADSGKTVPIGFCWAWSDEQGFSGNMLSNGKYTIPLVEGTWFVGCDSFNPNKGEGEFYRAQEAIVTVTKGDTITQDFQLSKALFEIPDGVSETFSCTTLKEMRLPDGTIVKIPANALCTDGDVTVTADPATDVFRTNDAKLLMYAWNLEALQDGQLIESFNSNVTIIIPYSQEVVDEEGIDESNLLAKFFDDSTSTWQTPDNVTVDTEANLVTAQVDHFTEFAVTNSGDTKTSSEVKETTQKKQRHDIVITPWSKGGPQVAVWNKDGKLITTWFAYGQDLRMGITTFSGDLDGNGVPEVITIPGEGFSSQVRVFDGTNGKILSQFFAYDTAFKKGINLAVYDLDGDGDQEIITVPAKDATADVKIFDRNGTLVMRFNAYGSTFTKGALVAAMDLDGDKLGEVVTAPVDGSGQIRIWSASKDDGPVAQFDAYGAGYNKGIASLVLNDLDGDGKGEIITTPREGSSQVRIFNRSGKVITQFNAYGEGFKGGSRIAVGDTDGDGKQDLVALPNANGSAQARIFTKDGAVKSQFFAYPSETTRPGRFSAMLADLDANGKDEVIFGTGVDLGPNVRIFDQNGKTIAQFMALHPGFRGGMNVNAVAR